MRHRTTSFPAGTSSNKSTITSGDSDMDPNVFLCTLPDSRSINEIRNEYKIIRLCIKSLMKPTKKSRLTALNDVI